MSVSDEHLAAILSVRWPDGTYAHGSDIESCLRELQHLRAEVAQERARTERAEKERDEAVGLLRGYASDNRTAIEWVNDVSAFLRTLEQKA